MVAIICTTMLHNSDLSSGFLQIKSEIYFGYAIILSILDYFTVYPINSEAGIPYLVILVITSIASIT